MLLSGYYFKYRLNVGASFYTSLGILSFPVCFVKGNKTFSNNPKTFLSFFLKVFFTYSFYCQNPPFVSAGGVWFSILIRQVVVFLFSVCILIALNICNETVLLRNLERHNPIIRLHILQTLFVPLC